MSTNLVKAFPGKNLPRNIQYRIPKTIIETESNKITKDSLGYGTNKRFSKNTIGYKRKKNRIEFNLLKGATFLTIKRIAIDHDISHKSP